MWSKLLPFVVIFGHCWAMGSPGKMFLGVLESPGKVLDFFYKQESGNPDYSCNLSPLTINYLE